MESDIYRSRDEAYPFLADAPDKLACDFEILTDEIASLAGLLAQAVPVEYREEILRVEELVYHLNPAARTFFSITQEEVAWLSRRRQDYQQEFLQVRFVLPCGGRAACLAHLLRVKTKQLVRLLYRMVHSGLMGLEQAVDFGNLLSNYFFYLALKLNKTEGVEEREFQSRNYK